MSPAHRGATTPERDPRRAGSFAPAGPRSGDPRVKGLLALLIALLLVGGSWVAFHLGDRPVQPGGAAPGATATATPSGASSTGAARPRAALGPGQGMVVPAVGGQSATRGPRIDIYLDPQCPWCKRFHETLKAGFDDIRARGAATIVVHPKSFLDAELDNDASHRAAQGMACASDAGRLWEYTDAMFTGQPFEEGQGYTDVQLEQFATTAGIDGPRLTAWRSCVADDRYAAYVRQVEERTAREDRVLGTPTYRVDGHEVDLDDVLPEGSAPDPQAFFDQVRAP